MNRRNVCHAIGSFVVAPVRSAHLNDQVEPTKTIDVRCVGINSCNEAEQNTMAMLALRDAMIARRQFHYILNFPPGELRFNDAKWLANVRSVTVRGGPTKLRNTRLTGPNTERIPLWLNEIFLDSLGSAPGFGVQVAGSKIETVSCGSDIIILSDSGDASKFRPGMHCLVYGYNQTSFGYPPSMRYFEYARVQSVRGQIIRLDTVLSNSYRSDWVDLATNETGILYGSARVLALNRPGFSVTEYCELEDLAFMPSREGTGGSTVTSQDGSLYAGGCIQFVGRRLEINGFFYPTQGKTHTLQDCRIRFTEIDKVIDQVDFVNCDIEELSNGPACNQISLYGGHLRQPIANLNCRNFFSLGTTFSMGRLDRHQFVAAASSMAMRSIKIHNPKLIAGRSKTTPLVRATAQIFISTLSVFAPNRIVCAYKGVADPILRGLDTGSILRSLSSCIYIIVDAIFHNSGATVVQGTWFNGSPQAGEVFVCNLLHDLEVKNPVEEGNADGAQHMSFLAQVASVAFTDRRDVPLLE